MATDQNLEVLISANAEGVKTGMVDAEKAVKSAGANMAQALKEVEAQSSMAAATMTGSFKQMSVAAMDSHTAITGHLGNIGSAFSKLTGPIMAVAGIMAGGAMFRDAIHSTMEMTGEANKLARQLGITAGAASILRIALGDVYLSTDDVSAATSSMARQLRTNEAAMNDMGLRTREANGELRPQMNIMRDAGALVETYREGMDRTNATVALFGRGVHDSGTAIKFAKLNMEEAEEKARSLGLVLTKQGAEDAKNYKAAMNDVGDVLEGVKKAVGDALIPVLTKLGEWFKEIGPLAVTVIRGAIGGLTAVFWGLKNAVVILWETLTAMIYSVTEPIVSLGQALVKLASGDMAGATNIMMSMPGRISARWSGALKEMLESSQDTAKHLAALFVDGPDAAKQKTGTKTMAMKGDKDGKDGKDEGMMRALELELALKKVAYQEQQRLEGSFREFSKQSELEYWQSKLSVVAAGSKDEVAIKLKIANEKLAIDKTAFTAQIASIHASGEEFKKNADVQLQVAQKVVNAMKKAYGEDSKEFIDAQRAMVAAQRAADQQRQDIAQQHRAVAKSQGLAEIEDARAVMQLKLSVGMITMAQSLELERQYAQQKLTIERGTLMAELAMVDPKKDPVQIAKLNAQIEELEIRHQAVIRGIEVKTQAESLKYYAAIGQGMQTSLESSFKGILTHTMSVGGAIRNMFTSMGSTLAGVASKMAADWVMNQIKMRLASKETALAQLNNNAMAAAGAAYNAVVGIPYVGPFLAPAAAAVAYAGVMAFGSLASAEGGYDIPAGTNPVTQLHQNEMVLPVKYADVIRGMADKGADRGEGGSSRSDGGGPLTVHNHVTISTPMNSRTRDQLLADMANATQRAVARNR